MNMKWTMIIILGLGLAPLYAEGPPSATTPPDSPAAQTPKPKPSKVSELAGRYNVPEKDVSDLRDKGMGWGEIKHALAISQKSGQPLSEVMKLRDSGMGWGKIAKQYGFKLGEVAGKGHKMDRTHAPESAREHSHSNGPKDPGSINGRGHGHGHGHGGPKH